MGSVAAEDVAAVLDTELRLAARLEARLLASEDDDGAGFPAALDVSGEGLSNVGDPPPQALSINNSDPTRVRLNSVLMAFMV